MLKILVTGATGNTGSQLVPALLKAGHQVRVFVRSAEKAQALKEQGADIYVGDLEKPETIPPALEGVDKIYLLTWNGETQAEQALNVINAAKQSGRKPHIVRHSAWGTDKCRIIKQMDDVEAALKSSGLPWTILKPTFFMQNTMMAAPTIQSDGAVYWDWKDGKAGMIDVRDVAESAFGALTGSGHEGKSYILTGPESISFADVASTFSKVLKKEVAYVKVPGEMSRESMLKMGVPEWIVGGYVELSEGFSENVADDVTDNVEKLTGHPARSFESFATDFKQAFSG